jgi:hypothetical protein
MQVAKNEDVGEWLVTFTREVAVGPHECVLSLRIKHFRKSKNLTSMLASTEDLGPSGKNLQDTWSRMLQVLHGVTPPVAESIVAACPSIATFWNIYRNESRPGQTETVLQNAMVRLCESRTFKIGSPIGIHCVGVESSTWTGGIEAYLSEFCVN